MCSLVTPFSVHTCQWQLINRPITAILDWRRHSQLRKNFCSFLFLMMRRHFFCSSPLSLFILLLHLSFKFICASWWSPQSPSLEWPPKVAVVDAAKLMIVAVRQSDAKVLPHYRCLRPLQPWLIFAKLAILCRLARKRGGHSNLVVWQQKERRGNLDETQRRCLFCFYCSIHDQFDHNDGHCKTGQRGGWCLHFSQSK